MELTIGETTLLICSVDLPEVSRNMELKDKKRGSFSEGDIKGMLATYLFHQSSQFAYPCIIAAPYQGALNPRLAFILGRNALIF